MILRRFSRRLALFLGLLLLAGCQRYQIGNRSLYRADIRTVYVPMFEADTFRRHMAERLYEAVVKEIELKTPFKVVNHPNADSVLTVRLTNEAKRIVIQSPTDEGREVQVSLVAHATWTDRRGTIIYEQAPVPLLPATATVEQTATFVPEYGESYATASQEAIEGMAERIVALMEQPW